MIIKNATTVHSYKGAGFLLGVVITMVIAVAAKYIAMLPFLSVMGQLVIAILLGIAYKRVAGVPEHAVGGIAFSSKRLLRFGIILLGLRLNLFDIAIAGPKVLAIAIINITVTIFVVYGLSRWLKIDKKLGILTACGTAICGAAAVVAIAPQLKASDNETAISATTVAILGTLFTLIYTFLYPVLHLSEGGYGIFSGATLHEIAHVIAAAAPGGREAVDLAVIVKMTRVAMLVPVAIIIGLWNNRQVSHSKKQRLKNVSIPWFIVGFLAMSAINTAGILPEAIAEQLIAAAYMLIAMAMAGLGLGVDLVLFKRLGKKTFVAGLIGSLLLSVLGLLLIYGFHLA
nr:YeiH family protein [Paenibacillus sp. PL91]MBC9198562.1 YeiH family putative sulfate export transporter [Paenibacillus sp. PL91]